MQHSMFRRDRGDYPPGSQIVDTLLKEAEVAVNHFVEPGKHADTLKLLRLDRKLLEIYAVRGRNMTAYAAQGSAGAMSEAYEEIAAASLRPPVSSERGRCATTTIASQR
jgi:hypothetical protein